MKASGPGVSPEDLTFRKSAEPQFRYRMRPLHCSSTFATARMAQDLQVTWRGSLFRGGKEDGTNCASISCLPGSTRTTLGIAYGSSSSRMRCLSILKMSMLEGLQNHAAFISIGASRSRDIRIIVHYERLIRSIKVKEQHQDDLNGRN